MPLYKDWDQFEKPSKIKVYLNNGKTLEINPLKLKGGKRVYDAILQAFIDDRFDITDKVVQGMTDSISEAKGTLCGRCGHVHVKGTPCPRPFKESKESTTFKVGDKVTYLGHPAEITKVNKEMTGAITYNVSYDKGTGKTKASNISNKGGEIKEGETKVKSFTLDSESASDSDKITDFLTSNNIKFTKTGSKIKISLDRDTPKASVILSKLKSLSNFDELNEGELTEANIPSNIRDFAKRKGVLPLVNKVAKWAEAVGARIAGGTAVGKNYSALVLDLDYNQQGEIRINTDNDTVTLYDEPVTAFNEFKRVYADRKSDNLEESKPDFLDLDKDGNKTEPMKKAAKDAKKGIKENKQNDFIANIDPNHPLATKDVEEWDDADMKKYKELWDKHHGNDTIKDMLKKAVTSKLKKDKGDLEEVDADPKSGAVILKKGTPPAEIQRYTTKNIDVEIKEGVYDFFEKTMDDDNYIDVSGPSVEMTMEEILADFEERIKDIPEESREEALRAIKTFWINMIKDWKPNLTTPHRAPVAESKKPLTEGKEYDYEGQMARTQLISIVKNAKSLFDSIGEKTQLQSWVQSKLTKAEDYLNGVRSYLDGESISNTAPLMVNNEPAKDDEGTALNIGDVVRAADGRIYQAVHSYSEGKAFLTPFDLKKRKTSNLSERHYFDAVAENEMSPTMKMYKVMPHTQTKGGFTK